MKRQLVILAVLGSLAPLSAWAAEGSWIFRSSYFSHTPDSGQRVSQYQPEQPAVARFDPTYQESGFRHNSVDLQVGRSGDHLHVVQTWGQGDQIRPYGEWLYPYRAGATPYGPWGNPQGPWTLPFDSWRNPYGLGQLPGPVWPGALMGGPGAAMASPWAGPSASAAPPQPMPPQPMPPQGSGSRMHGQQQQPQWQQPLQQ